MQTFDLTRTICVCGPVWFRKSLIRNSKSRSNVACFSFSERWLTGVYVESIKKKPSGRQTEAEINSQIRSWNQIAL